MQPKIISKIIDENGDHEIPSRSLRGDFKENS